MKIVFTLLLSLITITTAEAQASPTTAFTNAPSTQNTGHALNMGLKGFFTGSPQVRPSTSVTSSASDEFSNAGSVGDTVEAIARVQKRKQRIGVSGFNDQESSAIGSSSKGQSVGSDYEDYSIEHYSSSVDGSVGSKSGNQLSIIDASVSSDSDAGSGGCSARSCTSAGVVATIVAALTLVYLK